MRVAITGADGQLGRTLVRRWGSAAIPLARSQFNIADPQAVREVLGGLRPDVIINTAAYTAVERAEEESSLCRATNELGVRHLAEVAALLGSSLVQVSTDYVFGGDRSRRTPYRENDPPAPLGEYGRSKLAGEQAAGACPKHLIVRTCGLYGSTPPRTSFVETMLRLGRDRASLRVVNDQTCTPSYVEDVADAIVELVHRNAQGIFHVTNSGETNWCNFAEAIFRLAGMQVEVEAISSKEFGARVERPQFSVLDNGRFLELVGIRLRSWESALEAHLTQRCCTNRDAS